MNHKTWARIPMEEKSDIFISEGIVKEGALAEKLNL